MFKKVKMSFYPYITVGGHWELEIELLGRFLELLKIGTVVVTVADTVAGTVATGKNTIKTAIICSKRLYWFLGL